MNTRTCPLIAAAILVFPLVGLAAPQSAPKSAPKTKNTTESGKQTDVAKPATSTKPPVPLPPSAAVAPTSVAPPGYVIGPDDVLTVVFWREKDISGDVIVRPDGMISLPLINEVQAAGQTPDQLRMKLVDLASKYLEDPNAVVVVKQINSRKVFITGMVNKIGSYTLTAPTTVLQLITMAGGLQEYADGENIVVLRNENGKPMSYRFNYKDVLKRRNLAQNIQLLPGDTIVVP